MITRQAMRGLVIRQSVCLLRQEGNVGTTSQFRFVLLLYTEFEHL
jgi:hypothetical protein